MFYVILINIFLHFTPCSLVPWENLNCFRFFIWQGDSGACFGSFICTELLSFPLTLPLGTAVPRGNPEYVLGSYHMIPATLFKQWNDFPLMIKIFISSLIISYIFVVVVGERDCFSGTKISKWLSVTTNFYFNVSPDGNIPSWIQKYLIKDVGKCSEMFWEGHPVLFSRLLPWFLDAIRCAYRRQKQQLKLLTDSEQRLHPRRESIQGCAGTHLRTSSGQKKALTRNLLILVV